MSFYDTTYDALSCFLSRGHARARLWKSKLNNEERDVPAAATRLLDMPGSVGDCVADTASEVVGPS